MESQPFILFCQAGRLRSRLFCHSNDLITFRFGTSRKCVIIRKVVKGRYKAS